MKPLEQVLADAREDAAILARNGHAAQAETLVRLCDAVADAAHEYLTWLTEEEAMLRAGRQVEYLRGRFPEWEPAGHARRDGRRRLYRMIVVPRRARTDAAYQKGVDRGQAA